MRATIGRIAARASTSLIYRTFGAAALIAAALAGCAGTSGGRPEVIGLASCRAEDLAFCNGLAGRTHQSWGPTQIEYIAPDGQLYLWVGDRIQKGEWLIGHGLGTSMCYRYGSRISKCEKLSSELRMKDATTSGDPFGLASRTVPPFALAFADKRSFDQLLAEAGAASQAQPTPVPGLQGAR